MKGMEIRMDVSVADPALLRDGERLATICMDSAREAGATVRRIAYANLGEDTPPGCTVAILLDESHITVHTYADEGLLALNVFTCGKKANPYLAANLILEAVDGETLWTDSKERFPVDGG